MSYRNCVDRYFVTENGQLLDGGEDHDLGAHDYGRTVFHNFGTTISLGREAILHELEGSTVRHRGIHVRTTTSRRRARKGQTKLWEVWQG